MLIFLWGTGANGKSTFLDLLIHVLGTYALKAPSSMLMAQRNEPHPTEIAQLRGVRLAVCNEVREGSYWNEARIKELTGDTRLTARKMRQDFFQFDATAKLIIAANARPQFRAVDDAIRRRLILVPLEAKFEGPSRDPAILEKLKAESGAILSWLIEGAVEWYAHGLDVPASIRLASDEYLDAMDSLGQWLSECCVVTRERSDVESARDLYASYSAWRERQGETPISILRWGEQIKGRGPERYKSNGTKYHGVHLTIEERLRLSLKDQR